MSTATTTASGLSAQMEHRIRRAKSVNNLMTGVFGAIGGFFLMLIVALAAYIVARGLLSFDPVFLSFSRNGIMNQVFNTVYLVFLSLIVSVALGVPAGIYMAEYAPENRWTGFIRISIESLSSLPSIVVGLFGYLVFILMVGQQWNLLAGALAVSILNLPLVTTSTESALRALPSDLKYGSAALGATHWTTIVRVQLPAALPHLMTGVVLADDAVDRMFAEVTTEMIDFIVHADAADAQKAIDVIMIAKYLERIGDHATNIAEWVDFSITGVHDVSFDTKSA